VFSLVGEERLKNLIGGKDKETGFFYWRIGQDGLIGGGL
jgi:hypothetical protein